MLFRKKTYTNLDWHFFRIYVIIPILVALWCMILTVPLQAKQSEISDREINGAVESKFWKDEAVDANRIDIMTLKGIVTITGSARHILAKERAEKIAESIVGVRAVINRIKVEPDVRCSNAELVKAVESALQNNPATDSYKVKSQVKNGVVTLSGTVDSWQERRLSATVVKNVNGVIDIKNKTTVKYKTERSDIEIKKDIEARIENDAYVEDYLIEVEVKNSEVSISGTVGSLAEKNRAHNDAYINGVSSVDSSALKIKWWERDKMRCKSTYVTRSDDQIKIAVNDAFFYDPRVYSFNLDIDVNNGMVTLSGAVDNLKAKKKAEQDARSVTGVWRVKNLIKVRPVTVPDDDMLEKRVSDALHVNPRIDHFKIDIDSMAGWIYLSGKVSTALEKNIAEQVVEDIKGVVNVTNNITYPHVWKGKEDREIREDIKDELFWSPYVDKDQVNIAVSNGVVTLSGNVETWGEKKAAEYNSYEGGARNVINNLTVTYRINGPYGQSLYHHY